MNEQEIFEAALVFDAQRRAAYLERECGHDRRLRQRVENLLNMHDRAGNFFEKPAGEIVATVDIPPITERPGTVIGRYKLLEQIGEGGFGVVFMAEQTEPVRRKVALKIIKPGMDTKQVIARFEAERQALALMDHPNIAHVYDAGATGASVEPLGRRDLEDTRRADAAPLATGRPYFVMELVRGISITAYCDDNKFDTRQRLELFLQVCQAIQHAHQKGIIHRDIKPNNVLVTPHDGVPVVKVIDFGIAKAMTGQLTDKTLFTGFAQMIGTPLYMSPEQAEINALDVDTRSDIYSLGVLLYELLTGTTPFDKERLSKAGFDEIRRIIREEEPPRMSARVSTLNAELLSTISAKHHIDPQKLSQSLRGELDWIVMKCLEKDRRRRYETASGLAGDVQRCLNDEPVLACPPSVGYRLRKFVRRNTRALATATVVTLAVLVAAGALVVSYARISWESSEKTKALGAAKTSQQDAVISLKEALAAVDQMLTRVSEERLRDVPQMEPVRRDLLLDALRFYEKFLKRRGDDEAIRREVGLAYLRMGSLHHRLGNYRDSDGAYHKGFAIINELQAESPLEAPVRTRLIKFNIEFSWTLEKQGNHQEREKALRQAAAIADKLRKEFPEVSPYRDWLADARNRLANAIAGTKPAEAEKILRETLGLTENTDSLWHRGQTYQNLGVFLTNQRRYAEAEQACRQGVLSFEKAVAGSPSKTWIQGDLATTLRHLARAVNANGKPQDANEIYRRSIAIIDRLAANFPTGPHYRWGQMHVHFQYAPLLRKLQRLAEAEREYRLVVELAEKLADDFPTLPGYRWTAVARRRDLAQFLVETGRAQEGQQVYAGVVSRLEALAAPEKSKALKLRGHFHARLGEWDKAAADLTNAIELGSGDVMGVWYPLAVLHLRANRINEYRFLCKRLLKQLDQMDKPNNHFVVIICKLAPNSVADLSQPVHIAKKLVAREPQNAEYVGILGAALYRKGDLKAAVQELEAGIRSGPKQLGVHWRKLVLAMAYHRLGQQAQAQRLFKETTRWIESNAQGKLSWALRLDLELLYCEAEELLKQPGEVTNQKRQSCRTDS